MDNNRFIGFTLIMLLILTYYTFFPPGQNTSPEVSDEVVATESVDNNTVENIESIKENNPAMYELYARYYPTEPWSYCNDGVER